MQAHRRREQDELNEDDARDRVAEQPPARDARNHGVPQHVRGQQPEVREGMTKPPEVGARDDRVDAIDQAERPRQDQHEHFNRQAGGRQNPDDHRRQHPVHGQRHARHRVGPAPRAIAANHHAAPDPRADHQQRGADIERRMRHQRRIEGVQHRAGARENRDGGDQRAHQRDPEPRPGPRHAGHAPERRLGHQVAQRHDEEGGEDQRLKHTVRSHRQVIHSRRPEWHLHAGSRHRLHDGHHGAQRERGDRHPQIGQHQPCHCGHGVPSTITLPCIK